MIRLLPRPLIRPVDQAEYERLSEALEDFSNNVRSLPGVATIQSRLCLVAQLIDSQRRRRYVVDYLRSADIQESCLDPSSGKFDPIRGAIILGRQGDVDEAAWLVFLSVHFGFHRTRKWALPAAFYGRLSEGGLWDWESTILDLSGVRTWLDVNRDRMRSMGLYFGNHRKYESLYGNSESGTGAAIASYVDWVQSTTASGARPEASPGVTGEEQFRLAYESMKAVHRFGRTARFDYLTMLGKTDVFPGLLPDKPYLHDSTGPLAGARLLLDGTATSKAGATALTNELERLRLVLRVSNDVLEDGLCNWQKSPSSYLPFRG